MINTHTTIQDIIPHDAAVIPLIRYQDAEVFYLFCRDCGFEVESLIPRTMQPRSVRCPGCDRCGMMVGHPLNVVQR